jgi:S1-C subfamily serine protease
MKPPGEPVIAAGFSLFSEDDNVRPTVTRGIVAHVSDPVAVLQTTCCIQSGASGGALFSCTGNLLGLISCNIMDTSRRALFPRINMAVPASVLASPLNGFLRTGGRGKSLYLFKTGETKSMVSERSLAYYKN